MYIRLQREMEGPDQLSRYVTERNPVIRRCSTFFTSAGAVRDYFVGLDYDLDRLACDLSRQLWQKFKEKNGFQVGPSPKDVKFPELPELRVVKPQEFSIELVAYIKDIWGSIRNIGWLANQQYHLHGSYKDELIRTEKIGTRKVPWTKWEIRRYGLRKKAPVVREVPSVVVRGEVEFKDLDAEPHEYVLQVLTELGYDQRLVPTEEQMKEIKASKGSSRIEESDWSRKRADSGSIWEHIPFGQGIHDFWY